MESLTYRPLDLSGVERLIQWAGQEGWNPGINDAELFFATDPNGFLGCFDGDTMIAGGSIVSYDGKFGFMGLFIVHPDYRNRGLGKQLWDKRKETLQSRLSEGAAIGMDGVVAMQPFYQQGGFEIAFRDERYLRLGSSFDIPNTVCDLRSEHLKDVMEMDLEAFGVPRKNFLISWLQQPQGFSFGSLANGKISGFAHMRKAQVGYKIGPLFARDPDSADSLYRSCLNAAGGQSVCLDIPVNNPAAKDLVERYEAEYVFECARMYRGTPPKTNSDIVFGITSFELG